MLLAGMLLLFYSSSLPSVAVVCLLIFAGVTCYRFKIPLIRLLATFLVAFGWAGLFAIYNNANDLPDALVNQTSTLSGCILRVKRHAPSYQRILINVTEVIDDGASVEFQGKASLSHFGAVNGQFHNGWCGVMTANLKPVHSRLNRRGFDYEAWAYVEDIKALGTLVQLYDFKPGTDLYSRYLQLKSAMTDDLRQALSHKNAYELVISLALGERELIETGVWKVLRQSGTGHLLAISGLHIGLVFWMGSALSALIWRVSGNLPLYICAQKAGWLCGLACAGGYLLLTGFPLSGRRAWVMLACWVCVGIFNKRIELKQTLVIALWLILLIWPSSVLAIGFWFSYVAVALILSQLAHYKIRLNTQSSLSDHRITGKISQLIKLQCFLSLAICPLNVIYFGEISLISPLANLIAVPLVTFVILPVILLGTISHFAGWYIYSEPMLSYAADCLNWLYTGLSALTGVRGSLVMPQIVHTYAWILLLAGVFTYDQFRLWPGRWMLCFLFLPLLMIPNKQLNTGEYELSIFDVGQGLSIWFRSANHNMLVDTGFGIENSFNYFEHIIYPVLKAKGVNKLDTLVISHGDIDHAGGLSALIGSDLGVGQIFSSKTQSQSLGRFCGNKVAWQWDGIEFRFLTQEQVTGENNQSCVLKIHSNYGSALLPGDIERESELQLLRQFRELLDSQILIVPHHGSSTSSTPHFLSAVQPRIAAVSAGYLNRYGHPAGKIVDRYKTRNIKMLNTACGGELIFSIRKHGISHSQLRYKKQPFWRHRC